MAFDIDRYASQSSLLQRWDPRFKIASMGVFAFTVALLQSLPLALIGLFSAIVFILISRLPLHFVMHGLQFVMIFLFPFFLVLPLTYPGEAAFHVFGLVFAWEGLRLACMIVVKALAVVITAYAIFGSSRFDISMIALQKLRMPTILVQMMLFSYRYIFVFVDELKRMNTAMMARGFIKRADQRTLSVLGGLIGTLIVRSFERTERVYQAMLSKGYSGEFHTLRVFSSVSGDWFKGLLVLGLAAGLLYTNFIGLFPSAEQAWY